MWGPTHTETSNTAHLLDAARAGNSQASERLLQAHRPLITGYIAKRTRTLEDRDDLVQNVFLRATRNLGNFRSDCPFSQWMLRIAANELKNYYERNLGRRSEALDDFDWENCADLQQTIDQPGPYQEADDRNVAERLMKAAHQVCNESEFRVLMMVYQEESFEEIAELLEMKSATVRSHFLRARTKLLAYLVKSEPDLVGGVEAILLAESRASGEFDSREADAFRASDGKSEAFRSACLKVARYLPIPTLLLLSETLWTKI